MSLKDKLNEGENLYEITGLTSKDAEACMKELVFTIMDGGKIADVLSRVIDKLEADDKLMLFVITDWFAQAAVKIEDAAENMKPKSGAMDLGTFQ